MERERVFLIGVVAIIMNGMRLTALADAPDTLFFEAESDKVLSTDSSHPTTLFAGTLDDYEPAYAYFDSKSSSGSRYYINREISLEILRPYNIVRTAGEMTVQFQGVTRTHTNPHTASITVKFMQSGDSIVAYTMRAAALKPLDFELGLDLDAMVDAQNLRAEARPLTGNVRDAGYNICAVAMRKPATAIERVVHEGDAVGGTFSGNGAVTITHAAEDSTEYTGYLPNGSWVVVAPNHNLEDLDEVEGTYHYGRNLLLRQTAYNLKYTIVSGRLGNKTCQFQYNNGDLGAATTGALLQFRQNGSNVEVYFSQYRTYYVHPTNYVNGVLVKDYYADITAVGVDFEYLSTSASSPPQLRMYNSIALADSDGSHGVKDLKLKFRSRPTVVHDGYMPNGGDDGIPDTWMVVAENRQMSDIVEMESFYHSGANAGNYVPGVNLKVSGTSGSCQFQKAESSFMACLGLYLRDRNNNIEARTARWFNWYMYYVQSGVSYSNLVYYGTDFTLYSSSTVPKRDTYGKGSIATNDTMTGRGLKNLRLRFATGGITYAAASTSPVGHDLTFVGSADVPLVARTAASAVFPSNGVVTVAPYAELTVASHVANSRWTQYRVLTNGTLRMKGSSSTARTDQIDLVGGTLAIREDEPSATNSGSYINYLTLMNGAHVRGKIAIVLHDSQQANWIVAGDSPSYCESGLCITAAGGDGARTFCLNVQDVAAGTDFFVSGDIVDYGTQRTTSEFWNAHVIKDGAGTMELSGGVTLPNEICVSNGAVRIAEGCTFGVSRKRSTANGDGSEKVAEIWLAGGALETAAGATNTIGAVVAKVKDAPLNLGDGSKLTLAGFDFNAGANLLVSDNLGNGAELHIEGLTDAQRAHIRCGADRLRVREDANGNLEPYTAGFMLSVK